MKSNLMRRFPKCVVALDIYGAYSIWDYSGNLLFSDLSSERAFLIPENIEVNYE